MGVLKKLSPGMIFCYILLYFIHLMTPCQCQVTETVVVDAPFGKIRGLKILDNASGYHYLTFRGIPYAKPPVGDLRFRKPQPHPQIVGEFNATKQDRIECIIPQSLRGDDDHDDWFTENCLILNIQMKDTGVGTKPLKKVMIFIHGGKFMIGSSHIHQSNSFVINQDVIMVTINYRLGILGFLSTEDDSSPGNYGLWDQVMAMKWVKDNIQAFGGDPDDITISGGSSGGASVGYHCLTNHTKGLFTKAMLYSGTATSLFAISMDAQRDAVKVAKHAGCWDGDLHRKLDDIESGVLVNCLRQVAFEKLVNFRGFLLLGDYSFRPTIDRDFILDFPLHLLQDDDYLDEVGFFDKYYLVGHNNNEFSMIRYIIKCLKKKFEKKISHLPEKEKAMEWVSYLKVVEAIDSKNRLGYLKTNIPDDVYMEIEKFYDRRYKKDEILVELLYDLHILMPALDFLSACARRHSCTSYFLFFDHFPIYTHGNIKGVAHPMELVYWFDIKMPTIERFLSPNLAIQQSQEEIEMKKTFSLIIGHFMKTGEFGSALCDEGIPYWPKYDEKMTSHLQLNPTPWIGTSMDKGHQIFWHTTVPNMVIPGYTTPYNETICDHASMLAAPISFIFVTAILALASLMLEFR